MEKFVLLTAYPDPMVEQPLFCEGDLREYMASVMEMMLGMVDREPEDYVLNVDADEWAEFLAGKATIEVPRIDRDGMYVDDDGEVQVDVSYDRMRAISDPSAPFYVPGRCVTVIVPYQGQENLFSLRASTFSFNPPHAHVTSDALKFEYQYPSDKKIGVKAEVDRQLNEIESTLAHQRNDVRQHNDSLVVEAKAAIERRRQRALADREHIASLGIPVRERSDAPKTYAAPGIQKRPSPTSTAPTARKPEADEPVLVDSFYEHICRLTGAWGRAMERAPQTYGRFDEESLRDQLLVALNSHYEGKAVGEAFQGAGKTDVLVREGDRNVFVGECKVWTGPRAFLAAVDQLFSYTTWRDSKLALIVFVRAEGFSAIVQRARETLVRHAQFDVELESDDETQIITGMRWPEDDEKRSTLTVFFFHLAGSDADEGD